jgi:hypothetical protein
MEISKSIHHGCSFYVVSYSYIDGSKVFYYPYLVLHIKYTENLVLTCEFVPFLHSDAVEISTKLAFFLLNGSVTNDML